MNIEVDSIYPVTVTKIIKAGAVVQFEDGDTNLIHISNISDRFVSNVELFVQVGKTYDAMAIEGKVRPVELSLKHLRLQPASQNRSSDTFSSGHSDISTKSHRHSMKFESSPRPNYEKTEQSRHIHRDMKSVPRRSVDRMIDQADRDFADKFNYKFDRKQKRARRRNNNKRRREDW